MIKKQMFNVLNPKYRIPVYLFGIKPISRRMRTSRMGILFLLVSSMISLTVRSKQEFNEFMLAFFVSLIIIMTIEMIIKKQYTVIDSPIEIDEMDEINVLPS